MNRLPAHTAALVLSLALWTVMLPLSLALAGPVPYPPRYTAKRAVYLSDLNGGQSTAGGTIVLQGINPAGRVVGYFTTPDRTFAFGLDAGGTGLLPLAAALGPGDSQAACVNAAGAIAGVAWVKVKRQNGPSYLQQQGFVWQPGSPGGTSGSATFFLSPEGRDIDSVVALNRLGQVVGTYYSTSSDYKRAFFWDGSQCIDLGDAGNPDTFVWPVSLNDQGQVAGTLYYQAAQGGPVEPVDNQAAKPGAGGTANSTQPDGSASSSAFQWQRDANGNGTLSLLDSAGGGTFAGGVTLSQNQGGEIVGTYLPASSGSGSGGGNSSPAAFDWLGTQALDLGNLPGGGGGTLPFLVDDLGQVTGTGYAADGTLHLFVWSQWAGGGLVDQGSLPFYSGAGSTSFELAAVNGWGDAVGFYTDQYGSSRLYGRGGMGGALVDLTQATNQLEFSLGSDPSGWHARLSDTGLLACVGVYTDSQPLLGVWTADADGNGLPDGWTDRYFPNQSHVDPNTDADGDGISNLQEYRQGSDPTDFYNGAAPTPVIIGGGDQRGPAGTVLPQPLTLQVSHRASAPLHFAVTAGGALLSTRADGAGAATALDVTAGNAMLDADGFPRCAAQVFVVLPTGTGFVSTVTVTSTRGGAAPVSVSTTEVATSDSLAAPSGLGVAANSATTVDLQWTPADVTLGTAIEVSDDEQATWKLAAQFDPGTTAGTVYHLPPDHVYWFRAYTLPPPDNNGGGGTSTTSGTGGTQAASGPGSANSNAGRAECLSVPVVESTFGSAGGFNLSFPGFQNRDNRYLHLTTQASQILGDGNRQHRGTYTVQVTPLTSPALHGGWDQGGSSVEWFGVAGAWQALSDQHGTSTTTDNNGAVPAYAMEATVDTPYPLAMFLQQVEDLATVSPGNFFDGVPEAVLHLTYVPDTAERSYTWASGASADARYHDGLTYTYHYEISKALFRFRCNADPNGVVTYDVVFTPDDGSQPVTHEIHQVATHGQTEVLDTNGQPFLLDPTGKPGKPNGKYQVVPIQLQPKNYLNAGESGSGQSGTNAATNPQDASTPYLGMSNKIGDMVESILPSTNGHTYRPSFVSPKIGGMPKNDAECPTVDIVAQIPHELEGQFSTHFEWRAGPQNTATFTSDGYTAHVSRKAAGLCQLQVWTKKINPDDPEPAQVDAINVWIVWATITSTDIPIATQDDGISMTITGGYSFIHAIAPALICDQSSDAPNLADGNNSHPPGLTNTCNQDLADGADKHWDNSRRIRKKYITSTWFPTDCFDKEVDSYPSNALIGNDDATTRDETNDPYTNNAQLQGYDSPKRHRNHEVGTDGDSGENRLQFQEFTRLEIHGAWYIISDPYPWRIHMKFRRAQGKWINDGTTKATDNANF